MKRVVWIILDLILATTIALLGDIVASFFQERFDLTDPVRFSFVIFIFCVCLILLLFVTLKRVGSDKEAVSDENTLKVTQDIKGEIGPTGSATALNGSLPLGETEVKQIVEEHVAGKVVAVHLDKIP